MLAIAEPFHPLTYFLHTIVGTLGVALAFVALALAKGSRGHRLAGWIFTTAAVVAAVTAILFSVTAPSPLAISSSLMMLALVGGAVLALRPGTPRVRRAEAVATGLMALAWLILVLLGAAGLAMKGGWVPLPPGVAMPPLVVVLLPLAYAVFPTLFLLDDRRFRRPGGRERPRAFRRHLSRMAFSLAIAVHPPVVSFADDLAFPPMLAFFGPFLLWPAVLWAFRAHPLLRARAQQPA